MTHSEIAVTKMQAFPLPSSRRRLDPRVPEEEVLTFSSSTPTFPLRTVGKRTDG
jgi:hypothetical protein